MDNNFYKILPVKGFPSEKGETMDLKAIAVWLATGFFLDNDSFWNEVKWQRPEVDGPLWFYEPREITFDQCVEEFSSLFEKIVIELLGNKKPLLALSGGLDSRTLAVACKKLGIDPFTYSYQYPDSFKEARYGKLIATEAKWDFKEFDIPSGYLWDNIEKAASINHCYAEFTHPRQLAVVEEITKKGDIWLLGHMGDLLFDGMGIPDNYSDANQVQYVYKKFVKKGGEEIAEDFWNSNGFEGTFREYLMNRLKDLLCQIPISNANARTRAFKSMYSVTRWTNTNLSFFYNYKPMALPYYDDRMCRFVCRTPEKFLQGRQIQIEYIKRNAPELARIPWQDKDPYNLYTYHKHRSLQDFPRRLLTRSRRYWKEKILNKENILRNWENQFLGKNNEQNLKKWLFENPDMEKVIAPAIVNKYYKLFKENDPVYWSHSISMLLTLSLFSKKYL